MGDTAEPSDQFDSRQGHRDPLKELLQTARDGSQEAFGQLVEACRRYLKQVAERELSEDLQAKVSASDIVQETFLKARQGFDGFNGGSRRELMRWLRAILLNQLADVRRRYNHAAKRDLGREVSLDDSALGRQKANLPATDPSPSSQAASRESEEQLHRAIAALPDNLRTVLRLHHGDALGYDEIACRLGTTADAVRKTWCRAVKELRRNLDADDAPR